MKVKIKTFVPDSSRPTWLLELLMEVKTYFSETDLKQEDVSSTFLNIRSSMDNIKYVKRNARYKLSECVNVEEIGNKMTIYTVFKNKPMVEFSIE